MNPISWLADLLAAPDPRWPVRRANEAERLSSPAYRVDRDTPPVRPVPARCGDLGGCLIDETGRCVYGCEEEDR